MLCPNIGTVLSVSRKAFLLSVVFLISGSFEPLGVFLRLASHVVFVSCPDFVPW